jgi:large subunit ribosomal protein L16
MKIPKRTKYRKYHKNKVKVVANKTSALRFGSYGLKSLESGRITAQHIETLRQTIGRKIRPKGRLWIRAFPHLPVTSKPSEVRMGKGKGNVEYWVALVQPGKVLYEMEGVSEELAREAFALGAAKLPISTTFVKRTVM